jgi:hypothetical protein
MDRYFDILGYCDFLDFFFWFRLGNQNGGMSEGM